MDFEKSQSRRAFLGVAGGGLASSLLPRIAKTDASGVKSLESELATLLIEPVSLENLHARNTTRLRKDRSAVSHAQAWAKAYPQAARSLLQMAENDVHGRFILPGSGNEMADVGNPPRWHENALGDAESVWFLNRLKHWPRMLRTGAITGDPRFAEKVTAELDDWIAKCPCPPIDGDLTLLQKGFSAVTPWRALEVGIRMNESWPQTLRLLAETPLLTPERLARYVISAHQHGRVLAEICPLLWPEANHNHYLMENAGLLAVACLLPELRSAARRVADSDCRLIFAQAVNSSFLKPNAPPLPQTPRLRRRISAGLSHRPARSARQSRRSVNGYRRGRQYLSDATVWLHQGRTFVADLMVAMIAAPN